MTRHDDPFVRYLRSKEAIDDRALHRPTLADLGDRLDRHGQDHPSQPLRVVSIGAGTGAMCRRLLSWGVLDGHDQIKYVMVDRREGIADKAAAAFAEWARAAGWAASPTKDGFRIERHGREVSLTYMTSDLFDAMSALPKAIDLVIAHAVFDLLPLRRAITTVLSRVVDGGYLYAPITFDGRTAFRPAHDADDEIIAAYHETMRDGDSSGPDAGSNLLAALPEFGANVVSAGGSDWVIHPKHDSDERVFLAHILGFVEQSLGESDAVDEETLSEWLSTRHRQIETDELSYIAHNLDILAQLA
ncbi:SAM-dependent methyltransferase [Haloferax sp. DFSO52]|uniref:SAM-dependent methyltransferase n=1 Tax=Haloferax sp. DFSO52 TaxID=3388505 RepID=UPI003A8642D2